VPSLVKLHVEEEDSADIQELVGDADVVVTSALAYAEARAGFARRRRERLIGRLADVHRLRGATAVHLASFEALLARGEDLDLRFSCADERLVRAAKSLA
jgi:uncharacterized protein with PIN domain